VTIAGNNTSPSASSPAARQHERRALGVACGAHVLHDGYTDLLYVMLPIWQAEFGLAYAEIGILRSLYAGTMAAFQIPSGMIAERYRAGVVLALGTALAGLGYVLAGASAGLGMLAIALFLSGLGSSTQHPIASSLVARAFAGPRSLKALGTYNFTGDVGKMMVPLAGALLLTLVSWRSTVVIIGACGIAAAVAIAMIMPRVVAESAAHGVEAAEAQRHPTQRYGFSLLLSIGLIDSATRMAFLTFLPFLLTQKGASVPAVGLALSLVFAGGAVGKLACAFVGTRIGVVATVLLTEALTAVAILALLPLPLVAGFLLLPVIGVALNGTSSVLYGSVPLFVSPERRTRAFGLFYTGTIGAGAAAPVVFGAFGDFLGVPTTIALTGLFALLTIPPVVMLRPSFAR
jgi:FSR family fosmidomycin resistance protein-like MFS transporter